MSTAAVVPETVGLSGDDAWKTLSRVGKRRLLRDAFIRMRVADGFSHARSIAFMTTLVAVQGTIALVGLASLFDKGGIGDMVVATVKRAVPGEAGQVLTSAVLQAHAAAGEHRYSALIVGLVGYLVTSTTVMGQFERGLNRLYGVERDRPTVRKYGLALVFAISAGTLVALAFGCLAFGRELFHTSDAALNTVWAVGRWPLGMALIALGVAVLLRWSPRRRQPKLSWLAFGAGVSVLIWAVVTAGLGLFYRLSSSFGQTYGPLAGLVALLLWCLLSAVALLFGAAVAAQLESERAGSPAPQDPAKVAESEPDAHATPVPVAP
jgi:YihY family inner membrane protein